MHIDDDDPDLSAVPLLRERPNFASAAPPATMHPVQPAADDGHPLGAPTLIRRTTRTAVNWALVREMKAESAGRIEETIRRRQDKDGKAPSQQNLIMMSVPIIAAVVAQHAARATAQGDRWEAELQEAYGRAVEDAQFRKGRLQALFEIPDAEDITLYGCDSVRVYHLDGRVTELSPIADSDEELLEELAHMARTASPPRPFDANSTELTLMVDHRFRVHAIYPEVTARPSVNIRQHHLTVVGLGDLVDLDLMPPEVGQFLDAAVLARKSIVVAGEQGASKTTLLRALADAVPGNERIATLETDEELFTHRLPGRENDLPLVARAGMGERTTTGSRVGDVTVADMVYMTLRQRTTRRIIGEVRGGEAGALFQSMQSGGGAMTTIHTPNARAVPARLAERAAESRIYTVEEALRQVGERIDLIVYITLLDETWRGGGRERFVSAIHSCDPGDGAEPSLGDIYIKNPLTREPGVFTPHSDWGAIMTHYRRDLRRYRDGEAIAS